MDQLMLGAALRTSSRCWGRIHDTEARLESAGGEVYATATGRYMAIPREQVQSMHHDLISTPDCWPAAHIFGEGQAAQPDGESGA